MHSGFSSSRASVKKHKDPFEGPEELECKLQAISSVIATRR